MKSDLIHIKIYFNQHKTGFSNIISFWEIINFLKPVNNQKIAQSKNNI